MRIELTQDGGLTAAIPGLRKPPITLDTDDLPEAEAAELAHQVAAAGFFELPARPRAAPGRRRLPPLHAHRGRPGSEAHGRFRSVHAQRGAARTPAAD